MPLLKATFECEVLTPMFLSGVDQRSCELRAPSVRGALRFWYRALLGGQGVTDPDDLRRREAAVFGDAGSPEGAGRSSVAVRVHSRDLHERCKPPPQLPDWDSKASRENPNGKLRPNTGTGYLWFSVALGDNFRSFVEPGARFSVTFTALPGRQDALCEALRAFWLLAHLGGLGTRARRAAGSFWVRALRVSDGVAVPPFRSAFDPDLVRATLREWGLSAADAPGFPSLARGAQVVFEDLDAGSWTDAVRALGTSFKSFRFESRKEPDAERAGFGLPLTVGHKRDVRKLALSSQDGDGRRASPLHLRVVPVARPSGVAFGAAYTLLSGPFGPDDDHLQARYTEQRGRVESHPLPDLSLVRQYLGEVSEGAREDLLG